MSGDEAILLDIARALKLIIAFTRDTDPTAFFDDAKTQSAVLHQLLVLGEAVKRLTSEFRAEHASVPWVLIAGMRDNLIHEYDTVDLDEVWRTATHDVPRLLATLRTWLPPSKS